MTRARPAEGAVDVPFKYPTALICVDESGAKVDAGRLMVFAAVKFRQPGAFSRAVKDVRDRNDFTSEFKFNEITRDALCPYYDLIEQLGESDAHVAACVVDTNVYNPFASKRPLWEVHATLTAQLLIGCINRRELVGVLLDGISTPKGCSLEDEVRNRVNRHFRATSVVAAACLDSRTNDCLQVADLIASAVAFDRRRAAGVSGKPTSNKGKVVNRLVAALGVTDFRDQRNGRVNVLTLRGGSAERDRPHLRVLRKVPRAG